MDSFAYGVYYTMVILYAWLAYISTKTTEAAFTVLILALPGMYFLEEIGEWMGKKGWN